MKPAAGIAVNDQDVFCKKMINSYSVRPDDIQGMCLAEFAAKCIYTHEDQPIVNVIHMKIKTVNQIL